MIVTLCLPSVTRQDLELRDSFSIDASRVLSPHHTPHAKHVQAPGSEVLVDSNRYT